MGPSGGEPEKRRLGPPPKASSPAVTNVMRANKAKETGPEVAFRRALRAVGLPGYRKNWKKAPGKPDIAYPGQRVAIFVNGCFWHRCPRCALPLPKSNTDFWQRKFKLNKERDRRKIEDLESIGWIVMTFWECEVSVDAEGCAFKVSEVLGRE